MPKIVNFVDCYKCDKKCAQRSSLKHVESCIALDDTSCLVSAKSGPYFIIMSCTTNTTLKDLGNFLQIVWLKCCDHITSFDQDKSSTLFDLIQNDCSTIRYEYDMGSITEVDLQIIERETEVKLQDAPKRTITLLAQNVAPTIKCEKCKKVAIKVLFGECMCADCCDKEDTYDESTPIVNSPRNGVCGYCGDFLPKELRMFTKEYKTVQKKKVGKKVVNKKKDKS